ncbi:hypothetical protein AYL99_07045 [Fonsecaea erecta]|uniref:tRNA wybutosine-synthesizing protein 4 n=1 Tax=Fonsecaea erecta TaxID=1367422 RepID=A0A178ZFX1_9EURO|nr:hypothetical protein AYL99_07045 [Fonsecaea erecta]OAP57955.1 hypothetical protein AYL99_07045 [Fonsecaea erecta]
MGFYKSLRRCPGVVEFAPHLGNEHGQGRVEPELAANVRFVLDDVVCVPRLPRVPVAYDRLFLGLNKLLDSGCTLEVDPWDHWITRRNGNLLVFGVRSPSLPDPEMRFALDPLARAVQPLGVPQLLQNADPTESAHPERLPPRELQAAILRVTRRDPVEVDKDIGTLTECGKTNNATTAYKASTERLYLSKPHFHKFFSKKVKRASPAVHRGYWLRMRAIKWVIQQFLDRPSDQKKVIINFGAGYDPQPFRWLSQEGGLCSGFKFVDIDYDLVMETKRDIIMSTPELRKLLHFSSSSCTSSEPSVLLDSEEYAAIGCDMRNLRRLERLLKSIVNLDECSFLCIAEDSTSFMPVSAADSLIAWCSRLSKDVTFCLLEPCSPDQPDNPFTRKMTDHYIGLGTPLKSIFQYPDDRSQIQRFSNANFSQIDYQSLWELWADPRFLSPSQRMELDHVEPFDEWEEFALWASHYCLVIAQNGAHPTLPGKLIRVRADSVSSETSDISARTSSPCNPDSEHFAYRYYDDPGELCQRHHGSAYPIPDQDAVAIFGGAGSKSCLSTSAVCRPRHLNDETPIVLPPEVGARCCHVNTALNNGDNILVGGRLSPTQPLKDCWLQKGNIWYRIHDLPEGRYRHRIAPVTLPDNVFGALCFGGKVGPTRVATDVLLWEPHKGWRELRIFGKDPKPRFAPNFVCLGFNHGLLFGGMRQDGVICQGFWRWRLVIRDNAVQALRFRPSQGLDTSIGSYQYFARFGASYGFVQDYLLIIGGIGRLGCIPKTYEILSLTGTFSTWHDESKEPSFRVAAVEAMCLQDCPRPFLIGHSTLRTRTGMYVILGGGADCFNYGEYFNKGIWVLYEKEAGLAADWVTVPSKASKYPPANSDSSFTAVDRCPEGVLIAPALMADPEDFHAAVRVSRPLLMRGLDLGPCQMHSVDFLKTAILQNTMSEEMGNLLKSSAHVNMSLGQILDALGLSSTSFDIHSPAATLENSNPACTQKPQPDNGDLFVVPNQLSSVGPLTHSLRLDISKEISTKLRYSAMANIMFQLRGTRKLLLFPPSDQSKLEFLPGATTSNLDIFCDKTPLQEHIFYAPSGTSPHIAIQKPGDALFIPPFWSVASVIYFNSSNDRGRLYNGVFSSSSTSEKLSGLSSNGSISGSEPVYEVKEAPHIRDDWIDVTVNLSFRNLPPAVFTASPRHNSPPDLAAYEEGRRDLENIVKRFTSNVHHSGSMVNGQTALTNSAMSLDLMLASIPKDIAKAYLQRLGKELLMKADEL